MIMNGDISPETVVFGFIAAIVGIPLQIAFECWLESRRNRTKNLNNERAGSE
jgi:hypothetical protein